mgnify:FL=1
MTELRFRIIGTFPLDIDDVFQKSSAIEGARMALETFCAAVKELGGVATYSGREVTPRPRSATNPAEADADFAEVDDPRPNPGAERMVPRHEQQAEQPSIPEFMRRAGSAN